MLETNFQSTQTGQKLRIASIGIGPPVVLLHGYPDNLQIWSRVAPFLAERFRVIAFDWPGMGYSDPWPGGATPAHMADRLAELLDQWKIPQTNLIGLDMGGQPALVFAAQYPQRINKLVITNSLLFDDEETSWEIQLLRKFAWNRFLIRRFPRIVFYRALYTCLPLTGQPAKALQDDFWAAFKKKPVRAFISKMCAGYQSKLRELPEFYKQVQCPLLILWGKKDKHFSVAHAHKLHALLPHSNLELIPDGEHWMVLQHSDDVAQAILRFL